MIRWMLARPGPDLDAGGMLCRQEAIEGDRYRHPGRHRQWVMGRVTAKELLARHARACGQPVLPARRIHIHRTPDGWPRVHTIDGRELPVSLTISHTGERALCALCPLDEGTVGADIEPVAPKPQPLLEDFYTDGERERLAKLQDASHAGTATVIWCIKEAVLKARRSGFHQSAKTVEVLCLEHAPARVWQKATVRMQDGSRPSVWWRLRRDDMLAMALAKLQKVESISRPTSARA